MAACGDQAEVEKEGITIELTCEWEGDEPHTHGCNQVEDTTDGRKALCTWTWEGAR